MRKFPKYSTLFKHYIFSYIVVFAIPFIILSLGIHQIYIRNLSLELNNTKENYLNQIDSRLNNQLTEMNQVGNLLNMSQVIYFPTLGTEQEDELINQLKIYEHSYNGIDAIYLVFINQDTVLSSRGTMSLDAMLKHSKHFQVENIEGLIDEISNPLERISVFTSESVAVKHSPWSNREIFYSMPMGSYTNPIGSIYFVMNMDDIITNLREATELEEGMALFVNESNEIVLSSSLYPKLTREELTIAVPDLVDTENIIIEGTSYSISSIDSNLSGWRLINLTDTNRFYQPLYQIIIVVFLGLIAMLFIGLVIAYYFANKYYQPLRSLISIFDANISNDYNEWNIIESNVNKAFTEVSTLSQQVSDQIPIVKQATILELIEGRISNEDDFNKYLLELGLIFPYEYFTQIIIEIGDKNKSLLEKDIKYIDQRLSDVFLDQVSDLYNVYGVVPYLRNNQIFLIVNSNKPMHKIWTTLYEYLSKSLLSEKSFKQQIIKIGIGNTYTHWNKIKKSYFEASSVIDLLNNKDSGKNTILFFSDIVTDQSIDDLPTIIDYPTEQVMLLSQGLKQGDIELCKEIIDDVFESFDNKFSNEISRQMTISYIYNHLVQTANELKITLGWEFLVKLSDFIQSELAKDTLINLSMYIATQAKDQIEDLNIVIEKQVVQIIFENFDSSSLSLEQIASEFNISVSYVSKLVKQETGESFSSIIQALRMEKFKSLLVETNQPIKDIVTQVGYFDVSNFTRKFRKETGLTPSQYREAHQSIIK
ncbi:helix-turn-helix domain-containing protein [Fundicoccus sp. Sow4_H7]|uniref:helix-turn-helix domain-containing protein n=1 Tax=Fundicoccus sp. Sow4_H7 TaxID=3438784 RepID=UPI003F8FACFA